MHEFLAIVAHPRVFSTPTPLDRALDQVDAWLESPSLVLLAESDEFRPFLRELLVRSRVTGSKMHDARVAALCMVHGVRELWTADRDFGRFPALAARNPLAEAE